jgi:hypothetical protein
MAATDQESIQLFASLATIVTAVRPAWTLTSVDEG